MLCSKIKVEYTCSILESVLLWSDDIHNLQIQNHRSEGMIFTNNKESKDKLVQAGSDAELVVNLN